MDPSDWYVPVWNHMKSLFKLLDQGWELADHYVFERCEHMGSFLTCAAFVYYFLCPYHFHLVARALARAGFGVQAENNAVNTNVVVEPSTDNDAMTTSIVVEPSTGSSRMCPRRVNLVVSVDATPNDDTETRGAYARIDCPTTPLTSSTRTPSISPSSAPLFDDDVEVGMDLAMV